MVSRTVSTNDQLSAHMLRGTVREGAAYEEANAKQWKKWKVITSPVSRVYLSRMNGLDPAGGDHSDVI